MSVSYKIAGLALAGLFNTLAAGTALAADLEIANPWVRGTVAQQKATGAFMQITSATGGKLVSAASPAAGVVEIHEMVMDGNTMKMRAVPAVDLPAGKAVDLKPGGYHVMLMDLKAPLKAGEMLDLTLVVEGKDGKKETITLKAPVKALGAAMDGGMAGHKH